MAETEAKISSYSHAVLRILLGILFIAPGITKLLNPSAPLGMLSNLGFPIPDFFTWLLIISELVFGLCILVGWNVRYTILPLVLILVVALARVTIPGALTSGSWTSVIFHMIGIVGLIQLYARGPGMWSLSSK